MFSFQERDLSGEAIASKDLNKVNAKLKFLYRQSRYLTPAHRKLLCNALIQPHFDYGCSSWLPLLKKNLKTQNSKSSKQKCSFCQIYLRGHISIHCALEKWTGVISIHCALEKWTGFRLVTVEYCVANTVFNYWNGILPGYTHEMFKPSLCIYSARSQMTLDKPLWKKIQGKKAYPS